MIRCHSCGAEAVFHYDNEILLSATSDCKTVEKRTIIYKCSECSLLQKPITDEYLCTISNIYNDYGIYELTEGRDQIKFINGKQTTRGSIIVANLNGLLSEKAKILEIGAGKGSFVAELHKEYPLVEINVQDISKKNITELKKLAFVNKCFDIPPNEIEDKFDMICMIHCLEHVISPIDFITNIKQQMHDNSVMLIAVPDSFSNPSDILTYDHCSHFNRATLQKVLSACFKHVYSPEHQPTNEIVLLASDHESLNNSNIFSDNNIDTSALQRLKSILLNNQENLAVFGTGPVSVYCCDYLNEKCTCLLDEDDVKAGKSYRAKEIILPVNFRAGNKVLLPLSKTISDIIKAKYPNIDFITL
jgi:2-polyprenyl-3-methyl-5-hydroxy-6-metoxy-1,4-benzoquinol methylase